jgi:hypothetical protein
MLVSCCSQLGITWISSWLYSGWNEVHKASTATVFSLPICHILVTVGKKTLTGSPPFACRLRYIIPSPDTGYFGEYSGNLAKLLQRKKIKLKKIMGVYEEEMILIPRILILFYMLMPTFSDLSSRLTVSYSIISQQNSFHSKLQGEYTSFYTSKPSTFFSATSETSLDIAISS